MNEHWKSLGPLGFSKYEVSNLGKIRNIKNNRILKGTLLLNGYEKVGLYDNCGNKPKSKSIHSLVAKVFLPNPENKPTIDHINRDRTDNRVTNLRWATHAEQGLNKSKPKKIRKIFDQIDDVDSNEKWRLIPYSEFERIWVSNYGRIKKSYKIMRGYLCYGYLFITARNKNSRKRTQFRVHRLVLETFVGAKTHLFVNHKDGNKQNNRLDNLEYVTPKENMQHAAKTGLIKSKKVEQYSTDDEFIKQYDGVNEAARVTNTHSSHISAVCKGKRKTANGYIWRYV